MSSEIIQAMIPKVMGESELVGFFEDGSDEWHAQRGLGIGSSEVASCAEVPGAFKSKYALWIEKAGYYEPPEHDADTLMMFKMGHLQELTLDKYLAELKPHEIAVAAGSWRHVDDHTALLNPDRLVWDTQANRWRGREYKNTMRGFERDELPLKYVAQAEWCRGSLGLDEWELYALYSGAFVHGWVIKPGAFGSTAVTNMETGLTELVRGVSYGELKFSQRAFVQSLRDNNPPSIDGSLAAFDYVKSKHSEIDAKQSVEVTLEEAIELHEADFQSKHWSDRLTEAKAKIIDKMGEAKFVEVSLDGESKPLRVARRQKAPKGNTPTLYLSTSRAVKTALDVGASV